MKSSNPALTKAFQNRSLTDGEPMTIGGTVNKSLVLIFMTIASAYYAWQSAYPAGWQQHAVPEIPGWYFPGIIGSFVLALVIIFKKDWSPFLAPIYAVLEGVTLGALSALFEMRYPGIVFQAMMCTTGTFLGLLLAYRAGWIRATPKFKRGMMAAMLGIVLVYGVDMLLNFFGRNVPYLHEGGTIGVGISVVVTVVAALMLVIDFDLIEQGAQMGAPKYMEWYGAFSLLMTLIWLYLEFLQLLSKLQRR